MVSRDSITSNLTNTGTPLLRKRDIVVCILFLFQIYLFYRFEHGNSGWINDNNDDSRAKVKDAIHRAAEKPIVVARMTDHFFPSDLFEGPQDCEDFNDVPLTCIFKGKESLGEEGTNSADVHWYHAPHFNSRDLSNTDPKAHPSQLRCVLSLEPSSYYPQLDNPVYMKQFDIESSYRRSSEIPMWTYIMRGFSVERLQREPLPLSEKRNAIAYLNSNCKAKNGRQEIMQSIVDAGVTVDGLGTCGKLLNGASLNPAVDAIVGSRYGTDQFGHDQSDRKIEAFRSYKFCIAIENSNVQDYISAKIWQPLEAGCVPIYWGSPDIKDVVPDPNAILHYPDFDNDPKKLSREIERLMNDDEAYAEKLAWKNKPLEEWSPSFLAYVKEMDVEKHECRLCRLAMEERIRTVVEGE